MCSDIAFNYASSALTIFNNGHTVQVNYDGGSDCLQRTRFQLGTIPRASPQRTHPEWGSIPAGSPLRSYKDADGNLAVVGVLVKEGAEDPAYAEFLANLPPKKASLPRLITPSTLRR
jgi:carbonic anhydrase